MANLDNIMEIIGQAIFDDFPGRNKQGVPLNSEEEKSIEEINTFLSTVKDSYVLVQWPESQEYMEEDWFDEEAVFDVEGKFGSSAYFIPLTRVL